MKRWIASLTGVVVRLLMRIVTAPRPVWNGCGPVAAQRIYFANHSSHGDFVLIWTCLPPSLRQHARPVAAKDYWIKNRKRRFLINNVFNGVLIDRRHVGKHHNPMQLMYDALDNGESLILFPEGTRNTQSAIPQPFKSGLYHLAKAYPHVELVPVWINNLNRVLPKGEFVPIPLLCTVTFGTPIQLLEGECKEAFLQRSRNELLKLADDEILQAIS